MVLSTPDQRIKYLSYAYHGACHDFSVLKSELPPEQALWFRDKEVHVDLGYLGFRKLYECKYLFIPFKKPKGKDMPPEEKLKNTAKSSIRVKVENAIGGMKRYRFMSDRLRSHDINLYNKIAGIATGLWNYHLTC